LLELVASKIIGRRSRGFIQRDIILAKKGGEKRERRSKRKKKEEEEREASEVKKYSQLIERNSRLSKIKSIERKV
jgi:hypothetical protein